MAIEPTAASAVSPSLPAVQVYGMAVIGLMAGLTIGYLLRGSRTLISTGRPAASASPHSTPGGTMQDSGPNPTVMGQMAGSQA